MAAKDAFVCERCGACCDYDVILNDQDIERIAMFGYDIDDFVDIDIKDRKILKRKDGSCVFKAEEAGKTRCVIYASRPAVCSNYPFFGLDEVHSCKPEKNEVIARYKQVHGILKRREGISDPTVK